MTKDKWQNELQMIKNNRFIDKLTRYGSRVALQIGTKSYRYQELMILASEQAKAFESTSEIIWIETEDPLAFTIRFLAAQLSGNFPMIGGHHHDFELNSIKVTHRPFFIGVTSGTTGGPKVYARSWESWEAGFKQINQLFQFEKIENILTSSPLTTSLGLHTLCLALYLGKTFMKIDDVAALATIGVPSTLFSVPTFLLRQLDVLAVSSHLKSIIFGGGQLSAHMLAQLRPKLKTVALIEFYGSSETSFISFQSLNHGKTDLSVGRLFPEVKIAIDDHHALTVKSPYLFSGYLSSTKSSQPKQWVVDDLVAYESGQLYLLGRQSDMIDHAGNKVSPHDIEAIAKAHCQACVAFGVADPLYGQAIALLMVDPSHKPVLQEHLAQALPKYKWPQIYLRTEHIPLTKEMKLSRTQLATAYERGEFDAF